MSKIQKNNGTDTSCWEVADVGEPHETPMKFRPVLTNICISLLLMALLAVCFRF